jgi:hypothetical protein
VAYTLTQLTATHLPTLITNANSRVELEAEEVPQHLGSGNAADVMVLIGHTERDAVLVQAVMLALHVVPLTKQLTALAGNLWCVVNGS